MQKSSYFLLKIVGGFAFLLGFVFIIWLKRAGVNELYTSIEKETKKDSVNNEQLIKFLNRFYQEHKDKIDSSVAELKAIARDKASISNVANTNYSFKRESNKTVRISGKLINHHDFFVSVGILVIGYDKQGESLSAILSWPFGKGGVFAKGTRDFSIELSDPGNEIVTAMAIIAQVKIW